MDSFCQLNEKENDSEGSGLTEGLALGFSCDFWNPSSITMNK